VINTNLPSSYIAPFRGYSIPEVNKNSSGDEIADVNFLRRYRTYVPQNAKKRKPTSFNQL